MLDKTKILIFDDSYELVATLKVFLQQKGYEVTGVTTSSVFFEKLLNFKPDLLIIDVLLGPGVNGRDICKSIKSDRNTCNIPIILMSGSYPALENFAECKADEIIEKPFTISKLISQIETLRLHNLV